jgi:4-amino-4-deoxy-L-arabinose transferase-like glycosyltransferase
LKLADDEGYDLMTGFLCSKGFVLYKDIWWDQPPLVPICLGGVFHCFGPTLAGARLIAAAFGLLFFGSFYWLAARRLSLWAALMATFFLVSSPLLLLA